MKISHRLWLLLILLGAFAYRLYRLGAASLWYDETVSLYLARLDLIALTRHTAGDIHPPFYYYLLHIWGQSAGWSEFSAAFLSVFFGLLLVALAYRVSRDWFPTRTALLASFLIALSPYNLWYSQEVRMYTLGAFLGLVSLYFLMRALPKKPDSSRIGHRPSSIFSRDFCAYVIASALGMYTLYYFAFLLVFENLLLLIWLIRNSHSAVHDSQSAIRHTPFAIRNWILSQLAILVLFLPWLPIAWRQATDPPVPPWRSFIPLPNVLLESFTALTLGQSVEWQSPSWVWGVLFVFAGVIVASFRSQGTSRRVYDGILQFGAWSFGLFASVFFPLFIIYALSLWKPLFHVRYLFTYSPAFYILLAVGLEKIRNTQDATRASYFLFRFVFSLIVLASALSAFNFWFDPQYADDDLRGAVKRIESNWRPGDAVLINAGYAYPAFLYYFDQPIAWHGRLTNYHLPITANGAVVLQTGSIGGDANLGWNSAESDFYATTADETQAALARVFAAHPRVWMLRLYDTVVDPDGVVRDYFAQHARLIDDLGVSGSSFARAQGYLTSKTPLTQFPTGAIRREILLGNRIAFLGFEPNALSVHAGEPIDVDLYWRTKEALNVDARVYIGMFDADGKLVASTDELPLGNGLGTSRWGPDEIMREPARLIAPRNLPPGNYVLRIQMYNPLTNEPLVVEKSEWVAEGNLISLTLVRVE